MGAHPGGARAAFARNLERVLSLFPALVSRLGDAAANLSGGQQQMLAIGRALMGSPKLVLLDEPSLGLAPQIVSHVYGALTELKSSDRQSCSSNKRSEKPWRSAIEPMWSMAERLSSRGRAIMSGATSCSGTRISGSDAADLTRMIEGIAV